MTFAQSFTPFVIGACSTLFALGVAGVIRHIWPRMRMSDYQTAYWSHCSDCGMDRS